MWSRYWPWGGRFLLEHESCLSDIAHLSDLSSHASHCKRTMPVSFDGCLNTPPASRWIVSRTRRILDIVVAFSVLLVFGLPMMLIALGVRITSRGKALFSQDRVGLGGRLFRIYKFRSMTEDRGVNAGPGLTMDGDLRITPFGRFLRKFKLDELPQFYNVLRGDMSLVGPRPKLPQYAELRNMPYRPGITGVATIAFRCEGEILRGIDTDSIDLFYAERIKPLKARLDACYMCNATPFSDVQIVASTFLFCIMPAKGPTGERVAPSFPIYIRAGDMVSPKAPQVRSSAEG